MTTKYEIERKRRVSLSRDELIELLKEKGFAVKGAATKEIDTYFSRPDVDYMKTVECLRIRERDNFAEITYKPASTSATKLLGDTTVKEETNVTLKDVKDVSTAKILLSNIGMVKLVEVNKERLSFTHPKYESVVVALDNVKDVGIFLEIEVISDDKQTAIKNIEAVERLIGVDAMPTVKLPYRDLVMLAQKGKK